MALTMMVSLGGKETSTPSMLITRVINCSQLNIAYKRKKSLKMYPTTKRKIKYNDRSLTKQKGYNLVPSKNLFLCEISKKQNILPKQIFLTWLQISLLFLIRIKDKVNIRYCNKGNNKMSIHLLHSLTFDGTVQLSLSLLISIGLYNKKLSLLSSSFIVI